MGEITRIAPHSEVSLDSVGLESMLSACLQFGEPRLSYLQGGWYCAVDMKVSTAGASFKVASDFNNPGPRDAVRQCLDRIQLTIARK